MTKVASKLPNATIQWKGTDVCMDIHCSCGTHSHLDAEFAYFVRCPGCGIPYRVGEQVTLSPLTTEDEIREAVDFDILDPS